MFVLPERSRDTDSAETNIMIPWKLSSTHSRCSVPRITQLNILNASTLDDNDDDDDINNSRNV